MNEDPAPKSPARWFQRKKRDDSATLPQNPKEALEKWLYCAIGVFGVVGIYALLWPPPFLSPTYSGAERNVSYFLIFIGGETATAIAVWRGFQSKRQIDQFEQQIQDSRSERRVTRFEKAVDMATDPKSRIRREGGFEILRQMFSPSGENFDDIIGKNLNILRHLSVSNFKMTSKQRRGFRALYKGSRTSYEAGGGEDAKSFYEKTHKPFIDNLALDLWRETVNWRIEGKTRKSALKSAINGIDNPQATGREDSLFIASGINLEDIKFFIILDDGKMVSPSQHAYVSLRVSCFLQVEMHEATVDYVDFSKSHLLRINNAQIGQLDYSMSCIGTIFDEANVLFCNFEGANLEGASFEVTNITGSDFSQADNLAPGQFKKAYWLEPDDTQLVEKAKPKFPKNYVIDLEELKRPSQSREE